jgi:hypothetical protein
MWERASAVLDGAGSEEIDIQKPGWLSKVQRQVQEKVDRKGQFERLKIYSLPGRKFPNLLWAPAGPAVDLSTHKEEAGRPVSRARRPYYAF